MRIERSLLIEALIDLVKGRMRNRKEDTIHDALKLMFWGWIWVVYQESVKRTPSLCMWMFISQRRKHHYQMNVQKKRIPDRLKRAS
jgi:hypothetical protein